MIKITDLCKSYKIYDSKSGRLTEMLTGGRAKRHRLHHALKDINLEIPSGSTFGIIGMNGAGKSTLLKILTGTCSPTSGRFEMSGRVSSILELGAGFHPELTGEQNVQLNGSLLGLSSSEITSIMPQIAEFSELGSFFHTPVRTYSSGMYVRLAFSLATAINPDILIVDEALSVGDVYFQQKCVVRIKEFRKQGTTILFVSHDASAIKLLCDQVVFLDKGRVRDCGDTNQMLELYNASLPRNCSQTIDQQSTDNNWSTSSGNQKATICDVKLFCGDQQVTTVQVGDQVQLKIQVRFNTTVFNPTVGFLIRDRLGYDIFGINSSTFKKEEKVFNSGELAEFSFQFDVRLGPGEFTFSAAIHDGITHINDCYHWLDQALALKVIPKADYHFLGVSYLETKFEVGLQ